MAKPLKFNNRHGDIQEAKLFNHGERSMRIRRKLFKSNTKKYFKDFDKE